ncbi:MAG: hypothetical protein LBI10_04635 [Deltaproteobacteria bacterium]|jgi:hypothetical protein|nr:hypothetical protein [Deltaproteobacteria bacterium]
MKIREMYKYSNIRSNKYFINNNIDKVLFLDIDGVLQSHGSQSRFKHIANGDMENLYHDLENTFGIDYSKYDEYDVAAVYYDWNKQSVSLLKDILNQTGAKIVLSSDWRIFGKEMMYNFFKIHGLENYYIDNTTKKFFLKRSYVEKICNKFKKKLNLQSMNYRTVEILEYIDRHPFIKKYVAIDDMNLLRGLENHFVNTRYLLFEEHAKIAIDILNS